MSDGIQGPGFGGNAQPPGLHFDVSHQQMQMRRALSAYRNNIALPDVHVASRFDRSKPPELGEDGQEMTFERRQQLMAGKKPMLEQGEDGRVRVVEQDFRGQFDQDIEREELGKSAIANRPDARIVRPRELELGVTDIDHTMDATGDWIPDAGGQMSDCLYTAPNPQTDDDLVSELHAAIRAVVKASGDRRLGCRSVSTSSRALRYAKRALGAEGEARLLGIPVTIVPHRANEIRFHADHEVQELAGKYASVFVPGADPLVGVDASAETALMLEVVDPVHDQSDFDQTPTDEVDNAD